MKKLLLLFFVLFLSCEDNRVEEVSKEPMIANVGKWQIQLIHILTMVL